MHCPRLPLSVHLEDGHLAATYVLNKSKYVMYERGRSSNQIAVRPTCKIENSLMRSSRNVKTA